MSGYDLLLSSGALLTTVNVKTIDDRAHSSLVLIGQGIPNYGNYVAQDFVWLMENFAKNTPPEHPLIGQQWYNTATSKMNVYTSTGWRPLSGEANDLVITSNLAGFGEVDYINTHPFDASEQGHYWYQRDAGGNNIHIGLIARAFEQEAEYFGLIHADNTIGYFWLDDSSVWFGNDSNKSVTFGSNNLVQLTLTTNGALFLGEETGTGLGKGEIGMTKATSAPVAPGPGRGKLAFIADTVNPGKAALVAYAGTSSTPTVIMSNIGGGF